MSEIEELYERLKKLQEPKGYYFTADREQTFELLAALLLNKKRYGYMACPCRLASGDRERAGCRPSEARTAPPSWVREGLGPLTLPPEAVQPMREPFVLTVPPAGQPRRPRSEV